MKNEKIQDIDIKGPVNEQTPKAAAKTGKAEQLKSYHDPPYGVLEFT